MDFGSRKIFFLRLRRACRFLMRDNSGMFMHAWLGSAAYRILSMPEDSKVTFQTEKQRMIFFMWQLLSKHQFEDAARLLVHAIHSRPMPSSWIWRVAFLVLQSLDMRREFCLFNQVLDQFRTSDENNRILEAQLNHFISGDFELAQSYRSNRVARRQCSAYILGAEVWEPELHHVERLQSLYEGLATYALWLRQRSSVETSSDPDYANSIATDLAEKAFHRLQGVESLIANGHTCDVFVRPLVEILEYFGENQQALRLLKSYVRKVPENVNSLRYLIDWYRRQLYSCSATISSTTATSTTSKQHQAPMIASESADESEVVQQQPTTTVTAASMEKLTYRWMRYRVQFSRRLLPEPAPQRPAKFTTEGCLEERNLLRSRHPHMTTITACLRYGFYKESLELIFLLLDHPSWALYAEPWTLLRKSIRALGKRSAHVIHAWSLRQHSWSALHFKLPGLPSTATRVQKLLSKIPVSDHTHTVPRDYIWLTVDPLQLSMHSSQVSNAAVSVTDMSETEAMEVN